MNLSPTERLQELRQAVEESRRKLYPDSMIKYMEKAVEIATDLHEAWIEAKADSLSARQFRRSEGHKIDEGGRYVDALMVFSRMEADALLDNIVPPPHLPYVWSTMWHALIAAIFIDLDKERTDNDEN